MNPLLHKIFYTPEKTMLIHVGFGLLFAFLPQFFIFFYYALLISSISWIFFNSKSVKNTNSVVVLFFYLMMYEPVSRLLALHPFVPWELGKYFIILFVIYLIFKQKISTKFLFILALFLIIVIVVKGATWKNVFFNSTVFLGLLLTQDTFKTFKFSSFQVLRLFQTILLPLFVFLGASVNQIRDFQNRSFELGSNFILDKIPANQVATYMGVAFFLSIIPFFFNRTHKKKWTSFIAPVSFFIVGLLSFSRGGIITALFGLLVIILGNIVSGKFNYWVYIFLFSIIFIPIVFYINEVTSGNLFLRYKGETRGTLVGSKEITFDNYTTGRVSILLGDLETFKKHWLFGVEIGKSREYRTETESQLSHIEFSRVLSEHGLIGLFAFLILVSNGYRLFKEFSVSKQFRYLMFAVWAIGFVTTWHGATRTLLPFVLMSIPLFQIKDTKTINPI